MGRVERCLLRRQPVPSGSELRDPRLPRRQCCPVVRGRACVRAGSPFRGRGLVRGDRVAQPGDLGGQPLRLRLLPASLADERLECPSGQALRFLGETTLAGCT